MSETIPEDVMKAARATYDDLPLVYDGWDEEAVIEVIARAILAERARCAAVVRPFTGDTWKEELRVIMGGILSNIERKGR